MANKVWDRIITLPLAKLSSILIASVVVCALTRAMLIGERFPLPWPLVTAVLSTVGSGFQESLTSQMPPMMMVSMQVQAAAIP